MTRIFLVVLALSLTTGCGSSGRGAAAPVAVQEPAPPSFISRVWRVTESTSVAPGTYYVFLPDNTMLVTAPGAVEPTPGRWHFAGGGLVLIESGYRYPTDILQTGVDRFAIRIHQPGKVVDVTMVPVQ